MDLRKISDTERLSCGEKFGIYRKSLNKFNRGSFGKAAIVSKVSDAVLLLFFAFNMFDVLPVKAGGLIKSLFAVSGAGTLFITVACKDLATDIVLLAAHHCKHVIKFTKEKESFLEKMERRIKLVPSQKW